MDNSGYRLGSIYDTAGPFVILWRASSCSKRFKRFYALLRHCMPNERIMVCFSIAIKNKIKLTETKNWGAIGRDKVRKTATLHGLQLLSRTLSKNSKLR